MLAFPVHPRYARMLLAAQEYGCVYAACLVAALATLIQAALQMRHRNGVVGLIVGEQTGGDRRSSALGRGRAGAEREGLLEPAPTLTQMAPRQPECRGCRR